MKQNQSSREGRRIVASKLMRYAIAIPLLIAGIWLYVGAPMAGYGVHLIPDPTMGMFLALIAAILILTGYGFFAAAGLGQSTLKIASVVFILCTVNLPIAIYLFAADRLHHVPSTEAGHTATAIIEFGALYGSLSAICALGLHALRRYLNADARS